MMRKLEVSLAPTCLQPPLLQLPEYGGLKLGKGSCCVNRHGNGREAARGELKSVHCSQDSLTFSWGSFSLVSLDILGLKTCSALDAFPCSLDTGP